MDKYGLSCALCEAVVRVDAAGRPYCPLHGYTGGEPCTRGTVEEKKGDKTFSSLDDE